MTSSAVDPERLRQSRREVFLALFVAQAVALQMLEFFLPSPAPWLKLGLANILTLVALDLFGASGAWTVALGRILVASLLLGRFLTPGFFLSLSGGICATALMVAARRVAGPRLSAIGLSLLGAAGHGFGQLLVAWLLLVRHQAIWTLLAPMLLLALVTGTVNGLVADTVLRHLRAHRAFKAAD